jgi:hypothetical protein
MKVYEILNEAIYDTLEYALSSVANRDKAFVTQMPRKEYADQLKEMGLDIPSHVTITLKDGSEHQQKVKLGPFGSTLEPADGSYKRKIFKGGRNLYIIDGPLNMGPKTKFFSDHEFSKSADYKEFQEKYFAGTRKMHEEFQKKLQLDLGEKLSPVAKKAIADDLLGKVNDKKTAAVRKWFVDAGFTMKGGGELPSVEEFKKLGDLKGWIVSTRQFGGPNRGVDGVSIEIDWENKVFDHKGWSSSD